MTQLFKSCFDPVQKLFEATSDALLDDNGDDEDDDDDDVDCADHDGGHGDDDDDEEADDGDLISKFEMRTSTIKVWWLGMS